MNDHPDWTYHLDQAVADLFPLMKEVRRHLHRHPEPSGSELETARFVRDKLRLAALDPQSVAEGRGVLVDSKTSSARRIAMRGDMDALRIQDAKDTSYASSVPGVMHACGHDAHTAIVLGAALALATVERDGRLPWPTCWRAIFQPAEETNRGAIQMIRAGALDDVSAIISLHVDPARAVGSVGACSGAFTADCVELEFVVSGRGGHAARPHESLDPIATAAQLISSVYLFVPRRIDSQEPVVVSFGRIHGGENANVIPDRVVVGGTLRTLHESVTESTLAHIRRLAQGVAEASETEIQMRHLPGPPAVQNDSELARMFATVAGDLLGTEKVQPIRRPSMGGEDFANYLESIPGAMFRLGCKGGAGDATPLHSPEFDIDENALLVGAQIMARSVVVWNH